MQTLRQAETRTRQLDPRLNHWILPTWFYLQAEPQGPFFCHTGDFKNQTCRNWTILRPDRSLEWYALDRYGVLTLAHGCSLEFWIYDDGRVITPSGYHRVEQQYCPESSEVKTLIHTETLSALVSHRLTDSSLSMELTIVGCDMKRLRPVWILWVLRPFGENGVAPIYQLEYRNSALWINRKKTIVFEKEPSHSFFANETTGDILLYFKEGRGNTGTTSSKGFCTGLVGYSGLPGELPPFRATLCGRTEMPFGLTGGGGLLAGIYAKTNRLPFSGVIVTGTNWDGFWNTAIHHVRAFSPNTRPNLVCITQILALNRLNFFERSRAYLKLCLKKIRISGDFPAEFLGSAKWIAAVADYYRQSGDREWVVTNWPDIYKVGWHLLQSSNESGGLVANNLWICAAWRDMAELAQIMHKFDESRMFKALYLSLLQRLYGMITGMADLQNCLLDGFGSRELLQLLECSFPLHLWNEAEFNIKGWLHKFEQRFVRDGGVFSPIEFKGFDLELTAKWCQYLLWAGRDYDTPLRLLLNSAGGTWSWPDMVNPVSLMGIGKDGHEPRVLYQIILLWRLVFLHEVGNYLYILPGVFNCSFWEEPQLEIDQMSSKFGKISLSCKTIGAITQITLNAQYRQKPVKVRLRLNVSYQLSFADVDVSYDGRMLEADPDVQIIRLKKCTIDACLDNTFSTNI